MTISPENRRDFEISGVDAVRKLVKTGGYDWTKCEEAEEWLAERERSSEAKASEALAIARAQALQHRRDRWIAIAAAIIAAASMMITAYQTFMK